MAGGYCFFNNAAIAAQAIVERDRRAGRDPRRRRPPRQRHAADLLAPRGRARTSRSTRTRGASTRSSSATPTRSARGRAAAPTSTCRSRSAPTTRRTSSTSIARSSGSPHAPGSIVVVSLGFDTYQLDPIGDLALTTAGYHEMGRRVGRARAPARDPPGGRLLPARRSARTRAPGCAAPKADRPSRPTPARVPSPGHEHTELPEHVRKLVAEIETEIGEEHGVDDGRARRPRTSGTRADRRARRRSRPRPARSRRPSARSCSRSARTPTGRASPARPTASTGCTPS